MKLTMWLGALIVFWLGVVVGHYEGEGKELAGTICIVVLLLSALTLLLFLAIGITSHLGYNMKVVW